MAPDKGANVVGLVVEDAEGVPHLHRGSPSPYSLLAGPVSRARRRASGSAAGWSG
jgi:hypothetical protein